MNPERTAKPKKKNGDKNGDTPERTKEGPPRSRILPPRNTRKKTEFTGNHSGLMVGHHEMPLGTPKCPIKKRIRIYYHEMHEKGTGLSGMLTAETTTRSWLNSVNCKKPQVPPAWPSFSCVSCISWWLCSFSSRNPGFIPWWLWRSIPPP